MLGIESVNSLRREAEVPKWQEKIKLHLADFFFFFLFFSVLILCCHGDTWLHQNLTFSNFELRDAFLLKYLALFLNELCTCLKMCLSSRFMSVVSWPG